MDAQLTPRQQFKAAFMLESIRAGCTDEESLIKRAAGILDTLKAVKDVAFGYGIPVAAGLAAAPPLIGGAAGFTAAKATDIDDTDVEDAKNQELIDELQRQTDRLNRRRMAEQYAKTRVA